LTQPPFDDIHALDRAGLLSMLPFSLDSSQVSGGT
jgi:hypothetical protein